VSGTAARVLALDLGDARIGLALSDELGITAQPAGTLAATGGRADLEAIAELVRVRGVSRVVVGHPLLLSGEEGHRARRAREIADKLARSLDVPVELWDERLTTAQAEKALISDGVRRSRRRAVVDSIAAVLILQSWLGARGGGHFNV
jgi:putative Holliday junction resolvase